jgi:hypothetical protein
VLLGVGEYAYLSADDTSMHHASQGSWRHLGWLVLHEAARSNPNPVEMLGHLLLSAA